MDDLIEKLAREAAELINGGEFYNNAWYAPGHREAWRKAMEPAANRIEELEKTLKQAERLLWFAMQYRGYDTGPLAQPFVEHVYKNICETLGITK